MVTPLFSLFVAVMHLASACVIGRPRSLDRTRSVVKSMASFRALLAPTPVDRRMASELPLQACRRNIHRRKGLAACKSGAV